jgi:hypothetical protein
VSRWATHSGSGQPRGSLCKPEVTGSIPVRSTFIHAGLRRLLRPARAPQMPQTASQSSSPSCLFALVRTLRGGGGSIDPEFVFDEIDRVVEVWRELLDPF